MEIRQAKPSDQGRILEMIYSSGPEYYDFIYKTNRHSALEYLEYEFNSGRGIAGYKNLTVALINNKVVATGSFYTGRNHNKINLGSLMNMIQFYDFPKVLSIIKRTFPFTRSAYKPKKNEMYLTNFGVNEDSRGKGIGSKVLNHKIEEAKANHLNSFNLDIALNNPQAERLYLKFGFEIVEEKQFTGKRKGIVTPPGCKHMRLKL